MALGPDNERGLTPPLESGYEEVGGDRGSAYGGDIPFALYAHDREWLRYARDAYQSSRTWFDSSIRVALEKALANFRGVHPPGSKYYTEQFVKRSRIFRPKTRSAIRRGEAAAAVSFFSTHDVVHCSAVNESDPDQVLAAEVHNGLLNFRLNEPEMYWYLTLIGGCQDAQTTGVVISKQEWLYEERDQEYEFTYEEPDGTTTIERGTETEVLRDRPECRLVPVENFRFDPAADWRDPVNKSPYIIELVPMYVQDIVEKMARKNPITGEPYYRPLSHNLLAAAIQQDWDSVRKAREGQRVDKYDNDTHINLYQSVWVHRNIMRKGGRDWCWDTLGQELMLSNPLPIEQVYLHCRTGDRPYAMGMAIIEAHKQYPGGVPNLIEDLQAEANDVANLRLDNVKHAINKRWFVRRGAGVDIRSIVRNVPSSVTFMSDTEKDVKEVATQDVTSSSYAEQDRINLDIDDLLGNFSQSSVATNRQLNETVGGLNILAGDSSTMQEYTTRTMSETWVERALRHLVQMESIYESDETILATVAAQARTDMATVLRVMRLPVNTRCNVGFGATNPQKRIERLSLALTTVASFAPTMMGELDLSEVVKEVFGAAGYKDGSRFFPSLSQGGEEDPRVAALQRQVEELTAMVEGKQMEIEGRVRVAEIAAQAKIEDTRMRLEVEIMKLQAQGDLEQFRERAKARMAELDALFKAEDNDLKRREFYLQREALSHNIQQAEREWAARAELQGGEGAENLKGEDKGGVISRQRFDLIPHAGG